MRLRILAVGNKMPAWVDEGVAEYARRIPREFNVEWMDIPAAKRGRATALRYQELEAEALRAKLGDDYLCLLYTSPSPRDGLLSRMPSSA